MEQYACLYAAIARATSSASPCSPLSPHVCRRRACGLPLGWLGACLLVVTGGGAIANAQPFALDNPNDVKALQQLLVDRGFFAGGVDGVYGAATAAAVREAQRFYALPVDGIVGERTLSALRRDRPEPLSEAPPAPAATKGKAGGAEANDWVRELQQLLADRGFYRGDIDGIAGPLTQKAIVAAQTAYGLEPDGIAGEKTWAALQGDPSPSPQIGLSGNPQLDAVDSALGSEEDVKTLQEVLAKRGFYRGDIDGIAGPLTQKAIVAAQTAYGLEPDGIAGEKTWAALRAGPPPRQRFGHLSYNEVAPDRLVDVGNGVRLHADAADSFTRMVEDARRDGVLLQPLSGFRSVAEQQALFDAPIAAGTVTPTERASQVAPPGYSEHHTGFAVDVGDGRDPSANLSARFDRTAAFAWLEKHAGEYGFEMSFPPNNAQGIAYEPWHWRYVGSDESRATFKARSKSPNEV